MYDRREKKASGAFCRVTVSLAKYLKDVYFERFISTVAETELLLIRNNIFMIRTTYLKDVFFERFISAVAVTNYCCFGTTFS